MCFQGWSACALAIAVTVGATTLAHPQTREQAELEARADAAARLVQSRSAYFGSDSNVPRSVIDSQGQSTPNAPSDSLEVAFDVLRAAPMDSESIRGLIEAVRARRTESASSIRVDPPSNLDSEQIGVWNNLLARVLELEDQADAQLERALVGILNGLAAAPGFTDSSIESQVEVLNGLSEGGAEPESALLLAEQRAILHEYRAAALRKMTRVGDSHLDRLAEQDLSDGRASSVVDSSGATISPGDPSSVALAVDAGWIESARVDRLQRALPLLSASLVERVEEALSDESAPARPAAVDPPSTPPPISPGSSPVLPSRSDSDSSPAISNQRLVLSRITELEAGERRRRRRADGELSRLTARVAQLTSDAEATSAMSRFEPVRAERFDRVYVQARQLIGDIRAWWIRHRESYDGFAREGESLRNKIPALDLGSDREPEERIVWAELAVAVERLLRERDESLSEQDDLALSLLDTTLTVRRDLRSSVSLRASASRLEEIQGEFLEEVSEGPIWLWREVTQIGGWALSLRSSWNDLDTLRNIFSRSLDLLALLLGWVYLRARAVSWLRMFVEALTRLGDEEPKRWDGGRDSPPSRRELESIALPATDTLGGLILHYFLLPRSLLLAFVVLLWVSRRLYHAITATVRLVIARSRSQVDSLTGEIPLTLQSKALILRTARWLLVWWILSTLVGFFAWPLVRAYWWERMIFYLRWGAFALIAVYLLRKWAGAVRSYIVDHSEHNWLTSRIAKKNVGFFRSLFVSAVGAVYLVARVCFRVMVRFGWFKDLDVSIARRQLRAGDSARVPLPEPLAQRIESSPTPILTRTDDIARVRGHYLAWKLEARRGMLAIIGDRGVGKTAFLEQVSEILPQSEKCRVVSIGIEPKFRSSDFGDALARFTEPLGIELPEGAGRTVLKKGLQTKLSELPPSVVVVDDLHFFLRRTVGGFDTLKFYLNVMQASSDRHFWIVSLHRSAWRYVQGVSQSVKSGFRDQILLSQFSVKDLSDFLVARTRAAGFEPDFQTLVPERTLDEDQERAENRAAATYWQLLSQSASGNPAVAFSYWLSSLSPGSSTNGNGNNRDADAPSKRVGGDTEPKGSRDERKAGSDLHRLDVHLFEPHRSSEVEGLSDEYLFVLTALVIHDGLSLRELSDVLNLSVERVQLSCQHLESLGVLNRRGKFYSLAESWQPSVLKVLDQKNFAHN